MSTKWFRYLAHAEKSASAAATPGITIAFSGSTEPVWKNVWTAEKSGRLRMYSDGKSVQKSVITVDTHDLHTDGTRFGMAEIKLPAVNVPPAE